MRIPTFLICLVGFSSAMQAQTGFQSTPRDSRSRLPALETPANAAPARPLSPVAVRSYLEGAEAVDFCSIPGVFCDSFGAPNRHDSSASIQTIDPQKLLQGNLLRYLPQSTCYSMRSYEYTPTGPNSGILQPAKTDCPPSTSFKMKSAVLTAPRIVR